MNLLKLFGITSNENPIVNPYFSNYFAKSSKTFDFFDHKNPGRFINGEIKTFSTVLIPKSAKSLVSRNPPS